LIPVHCFRRNAFRFTKAYKFSKGIHSLRGIPENPPGFIRNPYKVVILDSCSLLSQECTFAGMLSVQQGHSSLTKAFIVSGAFLKNRQVLSGIHIMLSFWIPVHCFRRNVLRRNAFRSAKAFLDVCYSFAVIALLKRSLREAFISHNPLPT
jgi:hypothetical protein